MFSVKVLIIVQYVLFSTNELLVINGQQVYQFKPCGHDLFVIRNINRTSRSWRGVLNLEHAEGTRSLTSLNIDLKLDTRARLLWGVNKGNLTTSAGAFHLNYFPNPTGFRIEKFCVAAVDGFPIPSVESLVLNGEEICSNARKLPGSQTGRNFPFTPIHTTTTAPATEEAANLDVRHEPLPLSACGRRLIQHQELITSGQPSKEGDWPWHAAIYHVKSSFLTTYRCGGTLISPSIVLTAAHCVTEDGRAMVPSRIIIKLGLYNRLVSGRNAVETAVFKVIPHQNFDPGDLRNDIAVLELNTQIQYTNYIQPACLWPENSVNLEQIVGDIGTVVGWGLNEQEMLADVLTQGEMPVVSVFACLESNRDFFGLFLSDKNYCAGFRNGTSVCNGDSGGGMFFNRNGTYFMRGIVSLSVVLADKDVCNPKQYVLFTDVAKYLTWIKIYL